MKPSQMIQEMIQMGITKWTIKKELGVSWQTVRAWETGKIIPNSINQAKIEELFLSLKQEGKDEG